MSLTIVTGNDTKFGQMQQALALFGIQTMQATFDIPEIQSADPSVVITDKVQKAFAQVQGSVLVDDSGMFFLRYTNFPGVYSKDVFKSLDFAGVFRLFDEGDAAEFRTTVAYMDDTLDAPRLFTGTMAGKLTKEFDTEAQNREMPYAPMFIPDGFDATINTLSAEERNHDHRHNALAAFAKWWQTR